MTSIQNPTAGRRVLVVDDQEGLRVSLKQILSRKGFQVETAESGEQALEIARQNPFDVVLMDVKMPGLSGVETFLKMKQFCPQTHVILMTAFAVEEELAKALQQGVYAIIYKPFDIAKLLQILQDYLQSRSLILLTDPDDQARLNLRLLLESKLYSVTEAQSEDECLQKLRERRFEVLLIDPAAARGAATEFLHKIQECRPNIVVIVMMNEGLGTEELKDNAPHSMYRLQKPFEMDAVLALLERLVGPAPAHEGTP